MPGTPRTFQNEMLLGTPKTSDRANNIKTRRAFFIQKPRMRFQTQVPRYTSGPGNSSSYFLQISVLYILSETDDKSRDSKTETAVGGGLSAMTRYGAIPFAISMLRCLTVQLTSSWHFIDHRIATSISRG
jgi:hypothetical protein